jgi:hypothetical protein
MAQSGHQQTTDECPLLGVKRTSLFKGLVSAFYPCRSEMLQRKLSAALPISLVAICCFDGLV